jgi:hypothetical protein
LPEELLSMVEMQETADGKEVVMNFIRYFRDPEDKRFTKAIKMLNETINESLTELEIKGVSLVKAFVFTSFFTVTGYP